MTWSLQQIVWLGVLEANCAGDIITIRLETPIGLIELMAIVELDGRVLRAFGAHLQNAKGARPGVGNLYAIAQFILERLDLDEAIVEGAPRTTGARPGHRPVQFRFKRRRGAAAGGQAE
jgi:hypothetical protein